MLGAQVSEDGSVRRMLGSMGEVLVGPGGLRVRQVELVGPMLVLARMAGDADARPGESRLLVTRRGEFAAMVCDAAELAEHVDLAELRLK